MSDEHVDMAGVNKSNGYGYAIYGYRMVEAVP
jgi:hypothetical protein